MIYIFIPVWVGIVALLYNNQNKVTPNSISTDANQYRVTIFAAVIAFLPLFLTVSLGDPINDVPGYIGGFESLPSDFSIIDWENDKGPGFTFLEIVIKKIFGNNADAFRICIALIQSIPIIMLFRNYSENYFFSLSLFILGTSYVAWMMNGLRQFVAAAIIYSAIPWLLKKKYIRVILVILIACTIHNSAIFMLPIVFIIQGKAWNKKTIIFIIIAVIAIIAFSSNSSLFGDVASEFGYNDVEGAPGTNILGTLFNSIPVIFAFIYRDKVDNSDSAVNLFINMSIITTCMYFVASVTNGILIGRLPGYTGMANYILLPYLLKKCVDEYRSKNITIAIVVLYIIYYVYQMQFAKDLLF